MNRPNVMRSNSQRDRESGQALVEFALVLLPLVVLVGGVIQLGIAIANWHDANRIAYEGARFAAVDEWPGCPSSEVTCTADPPCDAAPRSALFGRTLLNYLRCEAVDAGMPGPVSVVVCQPAGAGVGHPVTVRLVSARVNFLSLDLFDMNRIGWLGLVLRGEATMRVAKPPLRYAPAVGC